MTVARKLLIPALGFFALVMLGLISVNLVATTYRQDQQEADDLRRLEQVLSARLKSLENLALALATQVANDPEVQAAFAAGDRDRLVALTQSAYAQLDAEFSVPQFQFHVPPATSFLRLHQLDRYGDDLSSFRFTVVAANAEQRPVSGLEIGRGGLGMRGVVPVRYAGQHLGTVEFGLDVDQALLQALKEQFGVDWQILLSRGPAEIATFEAAASGSAGPTPDLLLQATTLPAPVYASPAIYAQALGGATPITRLSAQTREFATLAVPLRDYSGAPIGVAEIIVDRTARLQVRNSQWLLSTLVMLGVLAIGGLGVTVIATRTLRPLSALTEAATAAAGGDLSRTVIVPGRDEVARLAQAFNSMTAQIGADIGALEARVAERTHALETAQAHTQDLVLQLREASRLAGLTSFELDLATQTVVLDEVFYELLGQPVPVLEAVPITTAVARYVHPDDGARLLAEIQSRIEAGSADEFGLEARFLHASGDVRQCLLSLEVFRDAAGQAARITGAIQDVTTARQSAEILTRRAVELETVAHLATSIATIAEPAEMLRAVVDLIKPSFGLYHAHIYLLNDAGDTLVLAAGAGEAGHQMVAQKRSIPLNREQSLVARAARTRQGVIANDVRQEPDFLPHPLLPETRSELAVPLLSGEAVLGVLDVQSDRVGHFTPEDVRIQTILAAQIGVALSNARQRQVEQVNNQQLAALIQTTAEMADPQADLAGHLNVIVQNAVRLLGVDDAGLWLPVGSGELELKANVQTPALVGNRLKLGEGLSGRVFADSQPLRVNDYQAWSGRRLPNVPFHAALAVPLMWRRQPIGVLAITYSHPGRRFTDGDERVALLFAAQVAANLESARALERSERALKELDTLTRRLTREGWQGYVDQQAGERLVSVYAEAAPAAEAAGPAIVQPLVMHGEVIGQLVANAAETGEQAEVAAILEAVAQGLSAHVENLRLAEQTQLALAQTEALYAISAQVSNATDLDTVLQAVARPARESGAHSAQLWLVEDRLAGTPTTLTLAAEWGQGTAGGVGTRRSVVDLPVARGDRHSAGQVLLIGEVSSAPYLDGASRRFCADLGAQAVAVLPLVIDQRWIGNLIISWPAARTFTEGDRRLYEALTDQAAVVVNNRLLFDQTQQRADREAVINAISQKIQGTVTVQGALQAAVQELGVALKARRASVALTLEGALVSASQPAPGNGHPGRETA